MNVAQLTKIQHALDTRTDKELDEATELMRQIFQELDEEGQEREFMTEQKGLARDVS